jgi:hypothetical protein
MTEQLDKLIVAYGAAARRGSEEAIRRSAVELRTFVVNATAAARAELDEITKALNLTLEDYGEDDRTWWLPAEPGPIDCGSVAEAVREMMRIGDAEARELERLRDLVAPLLEPARHPQHVRDLVEIDRAMRDRVWPAQDARLLRIRAVASALEAHARAALTPEPGHD